jgi:hypothetical protein
LPGREKGNGKELDEDVDETLSIAAIRCAVFGEISMAGSHAATGRKRYPLKRMAVMSRATVTGL